MTGVTLESLRASISAIELVRQVGRVANISNGGMNVTGLTRSAALGDRVEIICRGGRRLPGEVRGLDHGEISVLADGSMNGVAVGDRVVLQGEALIAPDYSWLGRVIDPFGQALDGHAIIRGPPAPFGGGPTAGAGRPQGAG